MPFRHFIKTPWGRGIAVGLAVWILFLTAAEFLPIVWDEGDTFARVDSVNRWAQSVGSGKRTETAKGEGTSAFSEETLRRAFPNTVTREGHPAGYVIVSALGRLLCEKLGWAASLDSSPNSSPKTFFSEKVSYRFGPIFLAAIAMGAVFYRLERLFSLKTAFFAVTSVLILPRVFVHFQIAFGDSVLMSGWLLSWALFYPALEKNLFALFWGIALGLTFASKFSGGLALIPFALYGAVLLWKGMRHRTGKSETLRKGRRIFFIGFPAAFLTFILLNPPIWHSPIRGIWTYFYLNTHRASYNIAISFLGEIYNLNRPLPFWNPLFWTVVTIPVGLLAVGLGTIGRTLAECWGLGENREKKLTEKSWGDDERDNFGRNHHADLLFLILNYSILIGIRMIPGLPVHDGVRLFAAAFPFFGILAGIGLARLGENRRRGLRIAAILILIGSASSLVLYFPQGLSYYNLLLGGLPGAEKAGMEATYYWDGFDDEAIAWVNSHLDDNFNDNKEIETEEMKVCPKGVLFNAASYLTLQRIRRSEGLDVSVETISRLAGKRRHYAADTVPDFRFYILQRRAGGLTDQDKWLIQNKKPLWQKTIRSSAVLGGPWNLTQTQLIEIYPYEDFLMACYYVRQAKMKEREKKTEGEKSEGKKLNEQIKK